MNKIGWCSKTINYVRGCNGINGKHCSYCYARRFNQRTWKEIFKIELDYCRKNNIMTSYSDLRENMQDFKPVFMYSQFAKPLPKKPMRIFLDSMSDVCWWQVEWMEKILNKIKEYPQHKFLFLSKKPRMAYKNYEFPENCFLGATITTNKEMIESNGYYNFLSIEPLLTKIDKFNIPGVKWLILGADSTRGKNKIIPKLEWIENIVNYCSDYNIPLYMKENIKDVWFQDGLNEITGLIQQFPEELKL